MLGLAALYLLAASFALPYLIRTKGMQIASEKSGGRVEIDKAYFNPFILELTVKGVRFFAPDDALLFSLRRFDINVDILHLLWGELSVEYLGVHGPKLFVVQEKDGRFNFDWLMHLGGGEAEKAAVPEEKGYALPSLRVETFDLDDGEVAFTDLSRSTPLQLHFAPIGLTLHDIDTAGGGRNGLHFFAGTEGDGLIDIKGRVRSFSPFAAAGSVDYDAGRLYDAWHFLQRISTLEVADGRLNLHFAYDVNLSDLNASRIDALRLMVKRLRIKPKAGDADVLRLASLTFGDGTVRPFASTARIGPITIDDLYIEAERKRDGTLNWEHYFSKTGNAHAAASAETNATEAAAWDAGIAAVMLRHLHIRFADRSFTPPVRFRLDDFNATARDVSTLPGTPLTFDTALLFNGALRCRAEGTAAYGPLDVSADAACRGADLTWFNPYIDKAVEAALAHFGLQLRSADLDLAFAARAAETNGTVAVTVKEGNATLKAFALTPKGSTQNAAALERLDISGITLSTAARNAGVEKVLLTHPSVAVSRLKNGATDWSEMVRPKPEPAAAKGTKELKAAEASPGWDARIVSVGVRGGELFFDDAVPVNPVTATVSRFDFDLKGVTTDPKKSIGLSGQWYLNGGGRFRLEGTLVPSPLTASLDFSARRVRLTPFSPYVEKATYAEIADGYVGVTGHADYRVSDRRPDLRVRGDFALDDLLVNDTREAMPLLLLNGLEAKQFLFELSPDRLFVDSVTLESLYSSIRVEADRSVNAATLLRAETASGGKAAAEEASQPASPFPVRIVRFVIGNGAVHFADRSLPLPFDTQIHDVKGQILGISTLPEDTTFLQLDGVVDRYGVAKAEGSLNPESPKAYTDIGVTFRNITLKTYTPYSGKFVGRAIDAGKLSVTLRYKIIDGAMQGENAMVINKIAMGKRIESNASVSLPLDFAIALLEDRDGVIDIDMPVQGDVNNPEFKWGGAVWKAFVNLLTKAVTAPFDLIGSMLGIEGDTLKAVPFEAGSARLDPAARERLDLLSKALAKRPKLGLTVRGTYALKEDTEVLKQKALVEEVIRSGSKEGVDAETALVPALLEPLFEQRLGEAALEALQEEIDALNLDDAKKRQRYNDRLIAALVRTQPLAADALETLAKARAETIRTYLNTGAGIAAERINEAAPKTAAALGGFVPAQIALDAVK